MPKRDRETGAAASASTEDARARTTSDLHVLAGAVNQRAERSMDAAEAEKRARTTLVQQILAVPPKQCFSPKALAAFKRKHVAMMNRNPTSKPPPPNQAQPMKPQMPLPPSAQLPPQ